MGKALERKMRHHANGEDLMNKRERERERERESMCVIF